MSITLPDLVTFIQSFVIICLTSANPEADNYLTLFTCLLVCLLACVSPLNFIRDNVALYVGSTKHVPRRMLAVELLL
jgi:hypothetical protein